MVLNGPYKVLMSNVLMVFPRLKFNGQSNQKHGGLVGEKGRGLFGGGEPPSMLPCLICGTIFL